MFRIERIVLQHLSLHAAPAIGVLLVAAACSSNNSTSAEGGTTCSSPGQFTMGPADDHCSLPDGGSIVQAVDFGVCHQSTDAGGDDGGGAGAGGDDGGGSSSSCPYASTMYGTQATMVQANDDDCKYRVAVAILSPICQGANVTFQVVATVRTDGSALTGAATGAEVFTTTPGDWDADSYCDTMSSHVTPTNNGALVPFTENPKGTYTGSFVFDRSGQWTVRFHFFESCDDQPNLPHGHAAFHITVP